MDQELKKVAADVPGVLLAASQHMEKMANDNVALVSENAELTHENKCMKLARRLEQRGLQQDMDYDQKVAALLRTPVEKIAHMEQAIELAAGGFRLGTTSEPEEKTSSATGAESRDALDSFINAGAAYNA